MPWQDVVLLIIIGGFVLAIWFAFRNLDAVAGKQLKELDEKTTKPLPPDAPKPGEPPKS